MTADLVHAVRWATELATVDKHGQSYRDAVTNAGRVIVEPAAPHPAEHVYEWFWHLDAFRTYSTAGASAIMPSEIATGSQTMGEVIEPWEYAALYAMDRARRNALLNGPEDLLAARPTLTVDAFDAMFV